ncbi:hypothetical protein D3C85_1286670 [compost metagenome]
MPSLADWSAPRAALAALEALVATSWAVALISLEAVATWSISRNWICMPSLVWRAISEDWSAVARASLMLCLICATVGCSLSRKRLNQLTRAPSSSFLLYCRR